MWWQGETRARSSGSNDLVGRPEAKPAPVRIGTLPTEDSLPLWVAEEMGYFSIEGPDSTLRSAASSRAQERDAALTAGAIDAFMGDIIAAANLEAGGTPNTIETIMLGADPSQGRFGSPPRPRATTSNRERGVSQLAACRSAPPRRPSGVRARRAHGRSRRVPAAEIEEGRGQEGPGALRAADGDKLKAAALPEPFLTLAEQGGAKIVGDDTKAEKNLSQTVLVFADKYLATPGWRCGGRSVLKAWDVAVGEINKAPEAYRDDAGREGAAAQAARDDLPGEHVSDRGAAQPRRVDAVLGG